MECNVTGRANAKTPFASPAARAEPRAAKKKSPTPFGIELFVLKSGGDLLSHVL
jgi:hypothetical protein